MHTLGVPAGGTTTRVHIMSLQRGSQSKEKWTNQVYSLSKSKKKKNPIIILELKKKSLLYKMAKHFMYSVFLDKSQGLHSPIHSEPERPVTKVTLITT